MHENKTAFNLLHRKHHSQQAALDATTSGYMALTEGGLSGAVPIAISYALGLATGNWWYTLAGGFGNSARLAPQCSSIMQCLALAPPAGPCTHRVCAAAGTVHQQLWLAGKILELCS